MRLQPWHVLAALVGGSVLLAGCTESRLDETRLRIEDDFGRAVNQDLAAQVANPDAGRDDSGPPPASNGARAALAQTRYRQDAVTPPSSVGASGTGTSAEATPPAAPLGAPTAGP
jgi:type IV pilus biogenesis protein CpaD/CtpE